MTFSKATSHILSSSKISKFLIKLFIHNNKYFTVKISGATIKEENLQKLLLPKIDCFDANF